MLPDTGLRMWIRVPSLKAFGRRLARRAPSISLEVRRGAKYASSSQRKVVWDPSSARVKKNTSLGGSHSACSGTSKTPWAIHWLNQATNVFGTWRVILYLPNPKVLIGQTKVNTFCLHSVYVTPFTLRQMWNGQYSLVIDISASVLDPPVDVPPFICSHGCEMQNVLQSTK